jgi:hypothetical protein
VDIDAESRVGAHGEASRGAPPPLSSPCTGEVETA